MAAVQILPVDPVGGDLKALSPLHDRHRPVLKPRIQRPGKERLHLLRPGVRRDIPVRRCPSENSVADTAAHHVSLEAGFCEN